MQTQSSCGYQTGYGSVGKAYDCSKLPEEIKGSLVQFRVDGLDFSYFAFDFAENNHGAIMQ